MKSAKTSFQKELEGKMKERKKKGLTTAVSSDSDGALDSDDDMLAGFKASQSPKSSSWAPPGKSKGNSPTTNLDKILKRNQYTDDDESEDDSLNKSNDMMKTMKKPWQPPAPRQAMKEKSSKFDREEDELKSVWKNSEDQQRNYKDDRKSPRNKFDLPDDLPKSFSDRKSPRNIFGPKSPKDFPERKSPKDVFGSKSPRDFTEKKAPKDIFGSKSPKDFDERKSPKDMFVSKIPKNYSDRKSPRDKSPKDLDEIKSPKDMFGSKIPKTYSDRKSPRDKSPLQPLDFNSPRDTEKRSILKYKNEKNSIFPDEVNDKKSPRPYRKESDKKSPSMRKSLEDISPVPTPRNNPKAPQERPIPQSRNKSRSPRNENLQKPHNRKSRFESDSESDDASPRRLKSLSQSPDKSKLRSKSNEPHSKLNSKSPSFHDEKYPGKRDEGSPAVNKRTRFSLSSSKKTDNSDDDDDDDIRKSRRKKSIDNDDKSRYERRYEERTKSSKFRSFSQTSKDGNKDEVDKRKSPFRDLDNKSREVKSDQRKEKYKKESYSDDSEEELSAFKPTPMVKDNRRMSSKDDQRDYDETEKAEYDNSKKEKFKEERSKNENDERRSSYCEEGILDLTKLKKREELSNKSKSAVMRKEQELLNEVIDEVEIQQRTMRYIDPVKATERKNNDNKINTIKKVRPKPRYEVTRPQSSREFNSTIDIRQNVYAEWYLERDKSARMEAVEKKKKVKEAEEKKKRDILEKKLEAKLAYNAWMDTKKDFGKDKIVMKKQEKEAELKKKLADAELKKDASLAYKIWKEGKEVELLEKESEKKKAEKDKLKSESRKKSAKVKDATKAYDKWKENKEDIIFYEKEKEEEAKMKKEREEARQKRIQEREAEKLYDKWLDKKEKKQDEMKRSRSSLSLNESMPAWSPPGRTIPIGR